MTLFNKVRMILLCAIVLLIATVANTLNTQKLVKCTDSQMCSPKSGSPACSFYEKIKPSRVKVVVELDNQLLDPIYYAFCIKVDEYAQLSLVNCKCITNATSFSSACVSHSLIFSAITIIASDYMRDHVNSTVRILIDGESSKYRYHQNIDGSAHVAYYTAILKLKNGVFLKRSVNSTGENIVFENNCKDNGNCVLDSSYPCVRNMDCGFRNETTQDGKIGSSMDVKIFLAWEGTALNSIPLRSSGLLPSRFRAFSFTNYLKQMVSVFVPKNDE